MTDNTNRINLINAINIHAFYFLKYILLLS